MKGTSLLRYGINYGLKKFYSYWPVASSIVLSIFGMSPDLWLVAAFFLLFKSYISSAQPKLKTACFI
jgi:hypothetical protein